MNELKKILDRDGMNRVIARMVHEVLERNKEMDQLAIVGIRTRGACLAERFLQKIRLLENRDVPLGVVDITLYRDDLSEIGPQPEVKGTQIDFDVSDKDIILVDDVLFTGRTIRCALDQLIDFGRPRSIQLAVLIDRGHRELPIRADYVGKNIPTSLDEEVVVKFSELDGEEEVVVAKKEGTKINPVKPV